MYTCKFCGFHSESLDDFEEDCQFHKGFWCPDCDGFNYFSPSPESHSFKLILEDKTKVSPKREPLDFPTRVSPLRWPGGKSKFVGEVLAHCNPANMENFVEPFAGGASVGLSLLLAGKIKELYLNDLDFGVFSLFETIKYMPTLLTSQIRSFIPSKEAYQQAQTIVQHNYEGLDTYDAAWNLLIVNRLAFSGIPKANCMGDPAARWNAPTLIKRIERIHSFKEHLHISCMDACQYIEEMYWKPNTTLFIDPPYKLKGKDLYINYYTDDDHSRLSFLLDELYKGIPGADMILTYDECEFIKEIYQFPDVESIGRKYSIAN